MNLYLLAEYNAMPVLREEMGFQDYARLYEFRYLPEKLETLQTLAEEENDPAMTATSLSLTLRSLDARTQEALIEGVVQAEVDCPGKNASFRRAVRQVYDLTLVQGEGTLISPLLDEDYGILRCHDQKRNEWSDCSKEEVKTYASAISKRRAKLKSNPYGYYGIYRTKKKSFAIATIKEGRIAASTGAPDKRIDREGTACGTGVKFTAGRLVDFMLKLGDIAEEQGDPAPDVRSFLDANSGEVATIDRMATPANVYELWLSTVDKSKSVNPHRLDLDATEEELEELKSWKTLSKKQAAKLASLTESVEAERQRLAGMKRKIGGFNKEKLQRWYAVLGYGKNAKKVLCPALQAWFQRVGLLEYR